MRRLRALQCLSVPSWEVPPNPSLYARPLRPKLGLFMEPFVFHRNYEIPRDGSESPFRGNRFLKMMIFETKYHKNLYFLDLFIFRVS